MAGNQATLLLRICLYCSKDHQLAETLELELDYSDKRSDYRMTNFPAQFVYARVLPSAVEG